MTVKDPQIIVSLNGETVVLTGTPERFLVNSDNPKLVEAAKKNMETITHVVLNPKYPLFAFPTGKSTMLELTASIVAVDWGRAHILQAPDEVKDAINNPMASIKPESNEISQSNRGS